MLSSKYPWKKKVPSTTKSAVLCLLLHFVRECIQMSVGTCTFFLLATHKHTPSIKSSMCLLKWKKECYSTTNNCRIQKQASTHCVPYRTSVCTKLIHVESFARITSSHFKITRGRGSSCQQIVSTFWECLASHPPLWHNNSLLTCEDQAQTGLRLAKMYGLFFTHTHCCCYYVRQLNAKRSACLATVWPCCGTWENSR